MTTIFKKASIIFLVSGLLFSWFYAGATDFSSPSFIVKDSVIKPGAGFSTSTSFQLWSSLGQEAIGTSTAPSFGLKAGLLFFPAPAAPPPPQLPGERGGAGGGGITIAPKPTITPLFIIGPCPLPGDFNCDGKVGFVDLSILLYHFEQPRIRAALYDLNSDGIVDIADISILFYFWTVPLT